MTNDPKSAELSAAVERLRPYVSEVIADSYMVCRGPENNRQWFTPAREWTYDIFEAARFELDQRDIAEHWLNIALQPIDQEQASDGEGK